MGVTLTGYGGVGEIGGNAFLLDDGRSRIFLDFGKRFGSDPRLDDRTGRDTRHMLPGWNDHFDDFLQPRQFSMVPDLIRLGIIPPDPSLYRQDRGGAPGHSPVDAVLVSHAHMDHCGLVGLLRPDVPILASAQSQATLRSLQVTSGGGVLNEHVVARPKGILPRKDGSPGRGTTWKDGDGSPVHVTRHYDDADGQLGSWSLRHFDVDHSIHGARATLIEGEVSLVYTGDFRMHGRAADATKRFIERAGGVDVLVTEGTRVSRSHDHGPGTDDEVEVESQIQSILDGAGDRFVGISFPPRDLDRFQSVWNVARRSGRRLVIPTKLAHLVAEVRDAGAELPDPLRDPHIAIHVPRRGNGVIGMPRGTLRMPQPDLCLRDAAVDDETWEAFWLHDHAPWEHRYLRSGHTVTSQQIGAAPHEYLFSISYWTINELLDIFPDGTVGEQGTYIHSMTQPFNDEMEISQRKLQRWLDVFGLQRENTHVSGHLSEEDLHWVIDEIGARCIVPVHSEAPDLTAQKYEARTGQKALVPEAGRALPLR